MEEIKTKIKNYKDLIEEVDKELNIIMAELSIISKKRNDIVKKIETLMTQKKLENIRKKFLNK
ncbi:MAG TPA: hypothetical protein PLD95_00640 [bacterium]|jgi:archaellum component FlaC|nr:hypothetical protein [bacterium]HOG37960.1 hypothetical protein [bacterium]HQI03019.1 hypothetical protein [bacterium]